MVRKTKEEAETRHAISRRGGKGLSGTRCQPYLPGGNRRRRGSHPRRHLLAFQEQGRSVRSHDPAGLRSPRSQTRRTPGRWAGKPRRRPARHCRLFHRHRRRRPPALHAGANRLAQVRNTSAKWPPSATTTTWVRQPPPEPQRGRNPPRRRGAATRLPPSIPRLAAVGLMAVIDGLVVNWTLDQSLFPSPNPARHR